jgi:4-amino-4-deoxy-L-arabinose transferase-like glycosyltransferase
MTWLRRSAVVTTAALAGLSYAWELGQDPLEPYYAAAVRSMSGSWHDFIFGAFDPAGTITLDKLPGAFWVQALSVHAFGYSTWAMVLPQVVEGVLTVLVLYRAVARLAGSAAGLIAALVVAASPAVVALDRGNISDSLMILLLVLAADAVSAAIARDRGSTWRLILAAVWVGLAFQAKMIEAWLVLPALGLAYLISGPGEVWRRVRQLVVAGVVAGVVSLAWMTAVSLVPAASRPYFDGSHDNSVYSQVFVYNGFGRFGEQTPLQLLNGELRQDVSVLALPHPSPGAGRLLDGELGRDTGWLLPAAVLIAIWGIVTLRRRPRGDPLRACFILWGCWLVTLWITFSAATTINTYYTAALAPAAGAIVGAGAAAIWSADRTSVSRRIGLAVVIAGTAAYAAWLVPSSGAHVPGWLVPAVIAVGALATATALASLVVRRDAVLAAALGGGIIAGSLAPAVASAGITASHESAFDTPFEPAGVARAIDTLPQLQTAINLLVPRLELVQNGAPDLMATQTAALGSVFASASGEEVLPIGGFTGTIPSPTLNQLQADIRAGQFHLVLAYSTTDPRLAWIAAHCRNVTKAGAAVPTYYCISSDAGG